MGMVARCIGHGMNVGIVQFVKGKWETGERAVLGGVSQPGHDHSHGRGVHLGNSGPSTGYLGGEHGMEPSQEYDL